jgi:[ribosomal protein S18]-alanine N-acetyltransferase
MAGVLRSPRSDEVDTIADWHPIAADEVRGWWELDYVRPWVLLDEEDRLVGYGELWVDPEEDEVELARLIVDPARRGRGLGKQLTYELMAKAAEAELATTMLRTTPDNVVAIGCYLACGFVRLSPEEEAEWNEGQRRAWVWMVLPPPAG